MEKGCGNQVFDYCHVISIKPEPPLVVPSQELNEEIPQMEQKQLPKQSIKSSSTAKKTELNNRNRQVKETRKSLNRNVNNGASREISNQLEKVQSSRPPASPRFEKSPSPARKPVNEDTSQKIRKSPNHRSISPSPRRTERKTFRSISMSSQSSGSSGGESRPGSGIVTSSDKEKQIRSETRTLNYPKVQKEPQAMKGSSESLSEGEETRRGE